VCVCGGGGGCGWWWWQTQIQFSTIFAVKPSLNWRFMSINFRQMDVQKAHETYRYLRRYVNLDSSVRENCVLA